METQTINRRSLTEQVQDQILEFIRSKELKVGDNLPPELELTEILQVSRSVIREALSRLRMLGILDSRKKRGMIVAEPDVFGGCQHIMDTAFLNEETQKSLVEIRMLLEIGLPELLFKNRTREDIAKLKTIADQAVTADEDRLSELDTVFHLELYKISRNPILYRFQSLLQPFWDNAMVGGNANASSETLIAKYNKLIEELETGTPESFRAAMLEHTNMLG